jgi:hypothetical protein
VTPFWPPGALSPVDANDAHAKWDAVFWVSGSCDTMRPTHRGVSI